MESERLHRRLTKGRRRPVPPSTGPRVLVGTVVSFWDVFYFFSSVRSTPYGPQCR